MNGDALQAAVIAALERRAAAQPGRVRQLLLQRAAALRAAQQAPASTDTPAPGTSALAELSALVDRLGRTAATPQRPGSTAPAPLKAVASFQGTWTRLRAEQRLRQALAQVPAQAGPLNSSQLVHRALQAMHSLSPAYLDAFMAHVDSLLSLDQASGGDIAAKRPARQRLG